MKFVHLLYPFLLILPLHSLPAISGEESSGSLCGKYIALKDCPIITPPTNIKEVLQNLGQIIKYKIFFTRDILDNEQKFQMVFGNQKFNRYYIYNFYSYLPLQKNSELLVNNYTSSYDNKAIFVLTKRIRPNYAPIIKINIYNIKEKNLTTYYINNSWGREAYKSPTILLPSNKILENSPNFLNSIGYTNYLYYQSPSTIGHNIVNHDRSYAKVFFNNENEITGLEVSLTN